MQHWSDFIEVQSNTTETLWYLNTAQNDFALQLINPINKKYIVSYTAIMNELYPVAFLSPSLDQPYWADPWYSPRIPIIEALPDSTTGDEWKDASAISDITGYSSFFGIPFQNFTNEGTYNLTIQSPYLRLTCPNITTITDTALDAMVAFGVTFSISSSKTLFLSINPPTQDTSGALKLASSIFSFANESDYNHTLAYTSCSMA
jgi:hypothetical protein